MTIRKTSGSLVLIDYSRRASYQADVTGTKGPSPGAVNVSRNGTNVTFPELTTPGLCWIKNMSDTYKVEYGIWNPQNTEFYPLGELLPGEEFVLRLSRNLREEYSSPGTGTGTGPQGSSELRFKAQWESGATGVDVDVSAWEA